MLSLFGGTYTAIAALKGWTDSIVHGHKKRRIDAAEELKKYDGRKHSQGIGKFYGGALDICCLIYHLAQAVPVIGFSVFSLWMTHWTINNFSGEIPHEQIEFWKKLISFSYWTVIITLIAITLVLVVAWILGKLLDSHMKTVTESFAPDVVAVVPPPK